MAFVILGIWGITYAFVPVRNLSQTLGENVIGIVDCFAILMAPAAVIVAVKAILATAKPGD